MYILARYYRRNKNKKRELHVVPEIPRFPFQLIAADYFTFKGQGYLIIVDRFSNWPVVKHCATGATGLINALKDVINTFGVPEELSTDGGTEFTSSVTQKVLDIMGIKHRLSSVAHPRSNGRAEVAVNNHEAPTDE